MILSSFSGKQLEVNEFNGPLGENMLPLANNTNQFNKSLINSSISPCCCISYVPFLSPCVQSYTRYKVLNHIYPESHWNEYSCFQNYSPKLCGYGKFMHTHGRKCPRTSMCIEAFFFPGNTASISRMLLMDKYKLSLDSCDNRLIRCNNICATLPPFARDCISDTISNCTIGCITSQIHQELNHQNIQETPDNITRHAYMESAFMEQSSESTAATSQGDITDDANESTPLIDVSSKVAASNRANKILNRLSISERSIII